MTSSAKTVEEYLKSLPEDRRQVISAVRRIVLKNLAPGFAECMQYGMIGYVVPHSIYPPGYHCTPEQPLPYAALGSQKNHMALYLMCVYGDPATDQWFREAWKASGKKLDMGKSCVRFKKLEDLPLDVIAQAIGRITVEKYIARVEAVLQQTRSKPAAKPKPAR